MSLHLLPNNDIKYREYAPGARGIPLFGEFNNWKRDIYWAKRDQFGFWELVIPMTKDNHLLDMEQKLKVMKIGLIETLFGLNI